MTAALKGRRIAVLVDGFEKIELTAPTPPLEDGAR